MAGETYVNTPSKPRPDTEDETWQVIIDDLAFGASVLDWTPINGEYGRITKRFLFRLSGRGPDVSGKICGSQDFAERNNRQ